MSKRSWSSFGAWALIVLVLWTIAWVIAEAIPTFNDLLGLISALFASWFTYGLSGVFWLYMNRGRYRESRRKVFLTGLNLMLVCLGAVIVSLICARFGGSAERPGGMVRKLIKVIFCRWGWGFMPLGRRSGPIRRAAVAVFLARIIRRRRLSGRFGRR